MAERFGNKSPVERIVLAFDFTNELAVGETLSGAITVSVTVSSGVDPTPSSILNGAASISGGNLILQPVKDGLSGVDYLISASAGTTALKVLERCGLLLVLNCA